MGKKHTVHLSIIIALFGLVLFSAGGVYAQSSANYSTKEYYFGTGGETDLNSGSYKARGAAGALGVGDTSSTNYTAKTGSVTPQEEYLELVVNASVVDLAGITTTTTGTGTGTFYVRTYTSSGYTVQTITGTPTYGAYSLTPMTVAAASSAGTEQFGMNLVANTVPTTFGADPALQPNSGFAYGVAAAGYNTTNIYKYNAGDTIATSPKGIGQTNFTISYIANQNSITRAGTYLIDQVLVVVATY